MKGQGGGGYRHGAPTELFKNGTRWNAVERVPAGFMGSKSENFFRGIPEARWLKGRLDHCAIGVSGQQFGFPCG